MNTALPPIDPTFEPAAVRTGSPAVKKAYSDALDFESMLVQQLTQSLAATSGLGGEGESEESEGASDPASSQLSSLLPQTLTEGVMSHGGLGLAPQLLGSIERSQGIAAADTPATATPAKVNTSGGVGA